VSRLVAVRADERAVECALHALALSFSEVLQLGWRKKHSRPQFWGGAKTKMKTKNKPSILELTVSIFLCLDLPDFVPWGGVF
jgi:hypothetical protein